MHGDRKRQMPAEMSVKKAANGGFIIRHSYDNATAGESYQPPTEHAFTSPHQAIKHVREHMAGMHGGGGEMAELAAAKGKVVAKQAHRLGANSGASAGAGTPRKVKATPSPKTAHPAGLKKAATRAQGLAAARTPGGGMD